MLVPGQLTDGERREVAIAIGRCHARARLPAPVSVVWVATPDDLDRPPSGRPLVRARPGAALRARRWLRIPRLVGLGVVVGGSGGVAAGLAVLVIGFGWPYWLSGAAAGAAYAALLRRILPRRYPSGSASAGVNAFAGLGMLAVLGAAVLVTSRWAGAWPTLPSAAVTPTLAGPAAAGGLLGGIVGWRRAMAGLTWKPGRWGVSSDPRDDFSTLIAAAAGRAAGGVSPRDAPVLIAVRRAVDRADPLGAWRGPVQPARLAAWALGERSARWPARVWRWRHRRALAAFQTSARVLWRAAPGRTLAVDPPAHLDRDPDGVPHRIDGPSVVWADGTPWFHLHGVRVPRRPDLGEWSVEEIHAVPNTEVRRVMIEAIGWDRYLRQARLERVADVPDPGNPPHRLELYELPDDVYGPFRLLLMTNGSPDRSGGLRRYAEFVPRGMDDPVEAVAWQYGVPAETYRRLQRRT